MPKSALTFIGHASLKFKTTDGKVIYVDPFFKGDYSDVADVLLITHNHRDHNAVRLVTKAENCLTVTPKEALSNDSYRTFEHGGIKVAAVQAYNKAHHRERCVGYVLEFDNLKIYCAGDTSKTDDMVNKLSKIGLDYALLPIDGISNMSAATASECAKIINVRHAIPIHNNPLCVITGRYSPRAVDKFEHIGKIVVKFGETIELD